MANIRDKPNISTEQLDFHMPDPNLVSTVYASENWIEVITATRKQNNAISMYRRLDGNHFLDGTTGEIRDYQKSPDKPPDASKFKPSFDELRRAICANVRGHGSELHVTLTVQNSLPADLETLYGYFTAFRKKLQYRYPGFEYIAIAEPHETGRYHLHVILVSSGGASAFLENDEIANLWNVGFTKTTYITNPEKIAGYFCSADKRKRWAEFYRPHRRLFRCSKGIVRPKPIRMMRREVNDYVREEGLHPSSDSCYAVKMSNPDGTTQTLNVITREQFRRG